MWNHSRSEKQIQVLISFQEAFQWPYLSFLRINFFQWELKADQRLPPNFLKTKLSGYLLLIILFY